MKIRFFALFFLIGLVVPSWAQNDTAKHLLNGVCVTAEHNSYTLRSTIPFQAITLKEISSLPAIQIADVLKHFSGVVVKDYGGVGGMKTVSVRGFGAQHTAVAYDDIAVADGQSGQIDLSKFSLQNVENITLCNGYDDDLLTPARLFNSASLLNLKTLTPEFQDDKKINLAFALTGGSFGYFNPTLRLENRWSKNKKAAYPFLASSLYINYLQSDGRYPFTLHYGGSGDSTSREKRTNSDLHALTAEGNLFADFTAHSHLKFKIYYYQAERGLSGAVILYNPHSAERLSDQNCFAQVQYVNHFNEHFSYMLNAKYNYAFQHYHDPDYLNADGFLDRQYGQNEAYLSNLVRFTPHKVIALSLSNDLVYNTMSSNETGFCQPTRFTTFTLLACQITTPYVNLRANLLHTYADNETRTGNAGKDVNRLSPAAGISVFPLKKENFTIRIFYKNIYRMPTFNDLYYREVGNLSLNPENTHQWNLGLAYQKSFFRKKMTLSIAADAFHNTIEDKIVAIPNKNLFYWTFLNFGKAEIDGLEAKLQYDYAIMKKIGISLSGNYTLQHAIDLTDKNSKSYRNQLPYVPLHSGSISLSINTIWCNLSCSLLWSGTRYTSSQNLPQNQLNAYYDCSLSLSKDFIIKKIKLGIKAELLNLADKHYEIIRNYPMQGRSVRCSLLFRY